MTIRMQRKKVLIVAPHPDDETLGCGGTILKHSLSQDKVYWLIMTNISTKDGYSEKRVKERQKEIEAVAKKYRFYDIFKMDFPTTRLDTLPRNQIVRMLSNVIGKVKPDTVYLPNKNDVHSDHKVTFDAVISSIKTFRCPFIKKVLMYEVISETEFSPPLRNNIFIPNLFSNITDYLDTKIKIMKIYRGEMKTHPFPRSMQNLKALAIFRGASAGVKYAEAFMTLKEIW